MTEHRQPAMSRQVEIYHEQRAEALAMSRTPRRPASCIFCKAFQGTDPELIHHQRLTAPLAECPPDACQDIHATRRMVATR